jgi:hypothetical protein
MNFQWPHTDPFLQSCAASTEQGAAAGRQLFETERFAQHIIGARVQQGNDWFRTGTGCEHHHRAVQLGRQPESRRFLKKLRTYKEMGGLTLTDLQGFPGGPHGSR